MHVSLRGIRHITNGYSGKAKDIHEKRKFSRFSVMKTAICFRYGRKMTMRTMNISLGGLKLEANFDLGVGESMVSAILTNGTRIPCRIRILGLYRLPPHPHLLLPMISMYEVSSGTPFPPPKIMTT